MNAGEKRLCDFMYRKSGGFFTNLFEAIFRADGENSVKLALGFPEEVEAVRRYHRDVGYWDRLETEYLGRKNESDV